MISIAETPFKLTHAEKLLSAATTLCMLTLSDAGAAVPKVSDISEPPQYGFTASASWEPCGPRFVRITDVQAGSVDWANVPYCECANPDAYALKSGDILVARSGSTGKTFLVETVPESAIFASYMIRLRTKPSVMPAYLYWCFQSQQFWHQMLEARRGSAMSNINGKMLSELRFPVPALHLQEAIVCFLNAFRQRLRGYDVPLPPLPTPLEEQRRIVGRIEELAARIEQTRGLRREAMAEADALRTSTRSTMFQELLADAYRRQTPLRTLSDVCELRIGATPARANAAYWGSTHLWVSIADLNGGIVTSTRESITDDGVESSSVKLIQPGTLLMSFKLSIGKFGIAGVPLYTNEAIVALPVKDSSVIEVPYLMNALLATDLGIGSKDAIKGATLNKASLAQIRFPVPPIAEQRRLVTRLNDVYGKLDVLAVEQGRTAAELDTLLPSVLDKAFRGEL